MRRGPTAAHGPPGSALLRAGWAPAHGAARSPAEPPTQPSTPPGLEGVARTRGLQGPRRRARVWGRGWWGGQEKAGGTDEGENDPVTRTGRPRELDEEGDGAARTRRPALGLPAAPRPAPRPAEARRGQRLCSPTVGPVPTAMPSSPRCPLAGGGGGRGGPRERAAAEHIRPPSRAPERGRAALTFFVLPLLLRGVSWAQAHKQEKSQPDRLRAALAGAGRGRDMGAQAPGPPAPWAGGPRPHFPPHWEPERCPPGKGRRRWVWPRGWGARGGGCGWRVSQRPGAQGSLTGPSPGACGPRPTPPC